MNESRYIDRARAIYADTSDDNIEIDDLPAILPVSDGVWVAAWVWVSNSEVEPDDTP